MENAEGAINILLVDDDPLVLKMYRDSLTRLGLAVDTASDGLAAVQFLKQKRPDVVVLDLLMPRFSGVDVLKFIRSEPALAGLPVIVLSNSYMNDMAGAALALGVQRALLKIRCSPSELLEIARDVAAGKPDSDPQAAQPPAPKTEPATVSEPSPQPPPPPVETAPPLPPKVAANAAEFMAKSREDFLASGAATISALRSLAEAFRNAPDSGERSQRLETFYRKVHFLSAMAGLAGCHQIAWLASGFEAMLFELMEKPELAGPSSLRTIVTTVDYLGLLFERARGPAQPDASAPPAHALVVDDDKVSNRVIVSALSRADVRAQSTDDPLTALQWLQKTRFDLILLDIEMPNMDGFEVCKRIRALPGYSKIPVIYVTNHSDFDHRARSVLSGGNELISKPVFPIELAVKAVTQMLKSRSAN